VASRQYPGVYWGHGDSATEPSLVAFDLTGRILTKVTLDGAPNLDWEDICADDAGHLYIADIGNNLALFPLRYIYKIEEPDVHGGDRINATPIEHIRFKYPAGNRFDAEGIFWRKGKLYITDKPRGRRTRVYRIDPAKPPYSRLTPIGEAQARFVTGADYLADDDAVLLCGYASAWIVPFASLSDEQPARATGMIRFPFTRGLEACCIGADGVIFASENGQVFRVDTAAFNQRTRFRRPVQNRK